MSDTKLSADEVRNMVRDRYGAIAAKAVADAAGKSSCCCGEPAAAERKSREMGYSAEQLALVPEEANLGLGCGNPQALAVMRRGEVVVDLGSGAGFDCLLAARAVGPEGHVIGVDMTPEMLARARGNAAKVGAANVEFRLGEIEHLPLADASADVVISNCVVNLVPDKAQVFREAFRVLRPGGRVAISDVVNIAPLPAELKSDPQLLCGCVSGAVPAGEVRTLLAAAGFVDIGVEIRPGSRDLVAEWAPGRGVENCVASAMVSARKPA